MYLENIIQVLHSVPSNVTQGSSLTILLKLVRENQSPSYHVIIKCRSDLVEMVGAPDYIPVSSQLMFTLLCV